MLDNTNSSTTTTIINTSNSSISHSNKYKKVTKVIKGKMNEETSSHNSILGAMLNEGSTISSNVVSSLSSLSSSPSTREIVSIDKLSQLLPSHLSTTSESSDSTTPVSVFIKNFRILWNSKHGHQWVSYNKTPLSIHINDKNGPILHLYRGMTYYFHISKDEEALYNAFMFTTSPCGGRNALPIPGGFNPIAQGTVCFRVTDDTPRYFFYQNFYEEFQGGLVIIHD